jgi:uncharacterized protein YunC (DUF1805 family)
MAFTNSPTSQQRIAMYAQTAADRRTYPAPAQQTSASTAQKLPKTRPDFHDFSGHLAAIRATATVARYDDSSDRSLKPQASSLAPQSSPMPTDLPRSTQRPMQFAGGTAIGSSHRWDGGQYCSILTRAGIVGCGIYDMKTPAEFGQAIAIARGTPANPLVEPEDLLTARIVDCTPQARAMGIEIGMTGKEAVERMLAACSIPNE